MKIKIFAAVFTTGTVFLMMSNSLTGETGAAFLKVGVGARTAGTGAAFASVVDDASALHWNPAGIATIRKRQLLLMHSEWLSDMNYEFAGFVQPTGKGAIGMGVSYLSQGNFEGRDEERRPVADFSARDMAISLSISRNARAVSLGMNLKFIQQNIESVKATGFAFDLGGKLQKAGSPVSLGAVLQNIGPQMKFINEGYDLPLTLSGGAAYKIRERLTLATDVRQRIHTGDTTVSVGLEYWAFNMLALRTGYLSQIASHSRAGSSFKNAKDSPTGNLAGLGAGIGLKIFNYQLDYALTPHEELGNTHRISLLASF